MTIDDDGQLLSLPQVIPNYKPEIGALATFILRYVLLPHSVLWSCYWPCEELPFCLGAVSSTTPFPVAMIPFFFLF
jgi:hypothetical protein